MILLLTSVSWRGRDLQKACVNNYVEDCKRGLKVKYNSEFFAEVNDTSQAFRESNTAIIPA